MKKIFLLASAFVLTVATSVAQTWNIGTPTETSVTATLSGTTLFISGTGKMRDYDFSSTLPWKNSGFTTVVVQNGVSGIGNYAFYNCSGLTAISFAESVENIGEAAFAGCSGLTAVELPDGVTGIGSSAFWGCSGLKEMTLPFVGGSATATSDGALFGYIFGTSSYTGGMETWQRYYTPPYSFFDKRYYIPAALRKVTIGGGSVEYGAFYGCYMLTSVTLGEGVTGIGSEAFYDCLFLASVDIPASVTSIGSYAFEGCRSLTSIDVPGSVESIGEGAFSGCSGLTDMTLPFVGASETATGLDNNTLFGYIFGAYSYTGGAETWQRSDPYYASVRYYLPAALRNVTITGGNLGYGAFGNCSMLTSVTLPGSMTSIGELAFAGCSGLTAVVNHRLTPQVINANVFDDYTYNNATLYVPAASYTAYSTTTGWENFYNLVTGTVEAGSVASPSAKVAGYYGILGGKLPQEPESGLYIILYDNGNAEKVVK